MQKAKVFAYDSICPECSGVLGYVMSERGYFCVDPDCIYSRDKSRGMCFAYFPDEEAMRYVRTWSWIQSSKKQKTNKRQYVR